MNAPAAITISDTDHLDSISVDVEPSADARRYDERVDLFTQWYRERSTSQKVAMTVVVPLAIATAIGCIAFFGLNSVSTAISSANSTELAGVTEQIDTLRVAIAVTVVISLMVSIALFRAIQSDVIGASGQLIDCLERIAGGEVDIVVPHTARTDQYGKLALVAEDIRQSSVKIMRQHEERAQAVKSELELQTRLKEQQEEAQRERENALREVADRFERTVGDVVSGVATASSQLQSTATMMASSADQASNKTSDVAVSMEDANAGATAAAAASDEFAMSIGEISRQAASSAELARKATNSATEADATMAALSDSASQVSEVVELIQTIAQRTNLLALNASIEAARGGEAGRGFAVVASEVKELAMQTSRATERVAEQIRTMQDTTGASVTALRSIASEVQQLETTAISIATAVDQQSVAGQDLAHSIDLAARGTHQVAGHITEVHELSVSTGAAASQVLSSSSALEEQASTLKNQVNTFLEKVRKG